MMPKDDEQLQLLIQFVLADDALQKFLISPANFQFTEDWAALHNAKKAARAAVPFGESGK